MNLNSYLVFILSTVAFPKILLLDVLCHVVEETQQQTVTNYDEDSDHNIHHDNFGVIRGHRRPVANIIYYPMMLHNKSPVEGSEKSSTSLGMVHPIILIIALAIPLLTILAFGSMLMPVVPIVLYFLNLLFPPASG